MSTSYMIGPVLYGPPNEPDGWKRVGWLTSTDMFHGAYLIRRPDGRRLMVPGDWDVEPIS